MRGFQHYLSADGERALASAQRASENIPRKHRWPRIFVFIHQIGAYQMIGDFEKAQSLIQEMIRDETLRGGISDGYLLACPCFVYWLEADLPALRQCHRS